MKELKTVIYKEWKCFIGSDRESLFFIQFLYYPGVSFWLVAMTRLCEQVLFGLCFSVVVAANFSNTVFISERISGALEILITSGLSRSSILFGKMSFVMGMSLVIGGS